MPRPSLTALFTVSFAAVLVGFVLLVGHAVSASVRQQALDGAADTTSAMAALSLHASQANTDRGEDIATVLRGYARAVPDVEHVALRDIDGRPFATTGRIPATLLTAPQLGARGAAQARLDGQRVVVDLRLAASDNLPAGTVLTVVLSYDEVAAAIHRETRRSYLILGIAALLLYLALLPLVVRVSRTVANSAEQRDRKPLAELRTALREGRFELHYQPLKDVAGGHVTGWEALVRLRRRDGVLVPPGDFIALAERTGFIHPLGAWVLDEACRQARVWHDAGFDGIVGVNVAPDQLLEGDLPALVADTLARHGLPAETLCLELTESATRGDLDALHETLTALRATGVVLALDDFGADWSSLARLRSLPLQVLKIDRALVPADADDDGAIRMVEAIVQLGHALGLEVVCEGIETSEQLDVLAAVGCDLAQGFLLGRPAAPAAVPPGHELRFALTPAG